MRLWTGKLYLKIPLQIDNSRNQMTARDTELLRRSCLVSTLKRAMFTALESSCLSSWLAGKHLTGEQENYCAATYPDESWGGEFELNDNCCLKLFQLSAKVPAITSPVGYSAAARHRLARSDGWPSTGGAVPCEIALPVCRRNRSLRPGKSPQLSCHFPLQSFCAVLLIDRFPTATARARIQAADVGGRPVAGPSCAAIKHGGGA